MKHPLARLAESWHAGRATGITSVCSAHPLVIEAALRFARDDGGPLLIEATCNQVNQDGGYTGMRPADFSALVRSIAKRAGCESVDIILGGDHLGPNPWRTLDAAEAMARADDMIAEYAAAGFTKLHLDTSMGCRGEPPALDDERTAERAARLARIAEAEAVGEVAPVYVIGTEVPIPGGAVEALDHLAITTSEDVLRTYAIHREAFDALGLEDAFSRVIALVVQPGVEFGHSDVAHFDAQQARALSATLEQLPGLVFEAHSTDYQTDAGLADLVRNGFAILKVGPWLTFALREALYGLDSVADALDGRAPGGTLMQTMERIMLTSPEHWQSHYEGSEAAKWLQRHFSLSDRIRYYWPEAEAASAVEALIDRLGDRKIPLALDYQYLGRTAGNTTRRGARDALIDAVADVLRRYRQAAREG